MLIRLSMRRHCRAICVKRAIYFSRSWRERPQRNFGREESDAVRLREAAAQRQWMPAVAAFGVCRLG